jgi:hypothetical protein
MGQISMTAAGILTGYSNQFGALTSVAGGILCLSQLFTADGLAGIWAGIQAAAGEVIAGLLDFVGTVVSDTIMAVTGMVSTRLLIIQDFINDIAQTVALIRAALSSLDDLAKATLDFLMGAANCNFAAAELGKCLAAGVIADLTRKTTSSLVEGSLEYQATVLNATAKLVGPDSGINKFINKSQMFANKAMIQQQF